MGTFARDIHCVGIIVLAFGAKVLKNSLGGWRLAWDWTEDNSWA
jgi:hypothetical protein